MRALVSVFLASRHPKLARADDVSGGRTGQDSVTAWIAVSFFILDWEIRVTPSQPNASAHRLAHALLSPAMACPSCGLSMFPVQPITPSSKLALALADPREDHSSKVFECLSTNINTCLPFSASIPLFHHHSRTAYSTRSDTTQLSPLPHYFEFYLN